jgi:hypothetical protein
MKRTRLASSMSGASAESLTALCAGRAHGSGTGARGRDFEASGVEIRLRAGSLTWRRSDA